jgi:hypothetical protein
MINEKKIIIFVQDVDLFKKLDNFNNRFWFTTIFENCKEKNPYQVIVFYNEAKWEAKFFFNDFFLKNKNLSYCLL